MKDVTLQINLSPGDIDYANLTCPELVQAHRDRVEEVLAVVDCCRPQKTHFVNVDDRFPPGVFQKRVERIGEIAEGLRAAGYFDRIVYLRPGDALLDHLWRKYLRNVIRETHDAGACALTAYLAALELPRTRYLLHYDADMLLYQAPGFDWIGEAHGFLERQPKAVAATPRLSPPTDQPKGDPETPHFYEESPPAAVEGGWRSDWISTRCFLMDLHKLAEYLPLLKGRLLVELILVKYFGHGYPRSPERMLSRRIGRVGGWKLYLSDERAWLLHPIAKPSQYVRLLPQILEAIRQGQVPEQQRGVPDIILTTWEDYCQTAGVSPVL
jgi:hypothetical protein